MAQQTDPRTPPGNGGDLLQQAKQTTSEVVGQVQQQAGSKIDQQKDVVANELEQITGAVRRLGDKLGQQEQGPIAHYAANYGKKAADGLDRLTNYLRHNDTKALVNELENIGRRQPALLLGGAFLLGLAGARFLKSSMASQVPAAGSNLRRGLPPPSPQPPHVHTTSAAL